MADRYTTALSPADEQAFQQWKAKNAPNDSGEDYDARGFFKSGGTTDERGHSTDQFKKPNHPTFSVESQYSSPGNEGGRWSEQGGKTHFTPSRANLKDRSYSDLQTYFQKYEPDAVLDPLPAQNNSGWTPVAESAPGWTRVQDQFDRTKAELGARPRMGFLDHAAELGKLAISPITAIPGALRSVAEFVQDPGSVARQNLNPQTAGGLPGAGSVNPLTDAFGNAVAAAATIKGTPSIHEPELARLRTAGPQETPPAATPAPAKGGMGMVDAIRLVQKLRKLTPGKLADAAIDAALSHIEEIAKPKPPVVPAEALKATALPTKPKPGQPTPEMLRQAQVPLTAAEQALADHVMAGTEPQPQAAGYENIPIQGPADMPATPAAGLQQPIQPGMQMPNGQGAAIAEPVPETPAAAAKKLSPGAQDANALADKLNDWKFSPKEAQGMNEKGWIKLAFDSGVKLPSAAVRKNAVYNLIKKQAGPPMTAEQLFEKFRGTAQGSP